MQKRRTTKQSKPVKKGNRVTMTELDGKLAEWVAIARSEGPVIVDRYESPWVCIVSYPTWQKISHLKSYIPADNHALINLREAIDNALAYAGDALVDLAERCESGVAPKIVIRAWVLQVVYSVWRDEMVCEALHYNMLWRWFVGYTDVWETLPEDTMFLRDMQRVSADPRVVDMIHRCLLNNMQMLADAGQFVVNYGLLNTLRAHFAVTEESHEAKESLTPHAADQKPKRNGPIMPG